MPWYIQCIRDFGAVKKTSSRILLGVKTDNTHLLISKTVLGTLVVSYSGTTLHGGDGGEKALFVPFEDGKTSERPFKELPQLL